MADDIPKKSKRRTKRGDDDDLPPPPEEARPVVRRGAAARRSPAPAASDDGEAPAKPIAGSGEDGDEQAEEKLEEPMDPLDSAIRNIVEAQQHSAETLTQLHQQRHQLHQVDRDLNDINHTMTRSERIMKGMRSLAGSFSNWLHKPKPQSDHLSSVAEPTKLRQQRQLGGGGAGAGMEDEQALGFRPPDVGTSTGDKKTDEQLDLINSLVGTIKQQAHVMKSELEEQRDLIDHVDTQTDVANEKLKRGIDTTRTIGAS